MSENSANDAACLEYADPVGRLLTAGETELSARANWPDYPGQYGLGPEHVPALIQMACDTALYTNESDGPEIWAPVHAWRTLAQLRAMQAIEPLLEFMRTPQADDAVADEFAVVFGMIGPAAIAPITALLADRTVAWLPASLAAGGLTEIVKRHPGCRDACVAILTAALRHAADTDPTSNGFMIGNLLDLNAVEAIDTIREAYRLNAVDRSIAGDLEDVEIDLGLRERRVTPKPNYPLLSANFTANAMTRSASDHVEYQTTEVRPRAMKIGRNEPCPCGSGKKYKKCCLEQ